MHSLPLALQNPSPAFRAAWDSFIHNDTNLGHAHRGYEGGDLSHHLVCINRQAGHSALRISQQITLSSPVDILDLGASAGALSLALAMQFPSARVYALEPEAEAHAVLVHMAQAVSQCRVIPFLGVGESIPLPDSSVDLVVCHTVLEHVRDPKKVLSEIARVLRPGGEAHIELPNYIWPMEPHLGTFFIPFSGKGMMKLLARLQGRSQSQAQFVDHLQLLTKFQFEEILAQNNFRFYNLVSDKIFSNHASDEHHVHLGWRRKLLSMLLVNGVGRGLLRLCLFLGLYPSLLYRLTKPTT